MKAHAIVFLLFVPLLVLSGCLPASSPPQQSSEPTVDLQSTAQVLAEMIAAQTLQALPTPTSLPPTETPTPELIVLPPPPTFETPDLLTQLPTLEATPTATLKSNENVWYCDRIPKFVTRGILNIENDTHKSIYVSLFGVSRPHEYHVCYEFPMRHATSLEIPLGSYTYVVIAGGATFKGTFDYKTTQKVTLTVYKDRVAIH